MNRLITIILFFVHLPFCASEQTICLNMIVRNESAVIKRALDSVKDWIDYWVIVDTGSVDGTQKIIRDHMKDIPGQLVERVWKNFAHNRNEALEIAKKHGDYILFLDADDWYEFEPNFEIPELSDDGYGIRFYYGDYFSYLKPHLIKSIVPWHWVGAYHEYVTCDRPFSSTELTQIKYMCGRDGARSNDPEKYHKAAQIFKDALNEEPNNERYVFYLSESLRDANQLEEAIESYAKRTLMGGWEEEIFWSLLQIAQLKQALNYPYDEVITSYYRAHCFRPHRPEPIYHLSCIFNQKGKFDLAYSTLKSYQFIQQPNIKDTLFIFNWISDYGLDFELSLAAYYTGHKEEFSQLCKQLLKKNLPISFRESVERNLKFDQSAIIH